MPSLELAELADRQTPTARFFSKVYDSLYTPGPLVQVGAIVVGAYIGLAIPAVIFKKFNWI
jgi:hypothetical protein